ncbi:hypothetical protein HYX08_03630 [Candidatus Woesearchaeota archaeon]|nr:hypothetical protein [Candidatus Woesearchaeota archaeon]
MRWSQRKVWVLSTIFIVIILTIGIFWFVSYNKSKNYDTVNNNLKTCLDNLKLKEAELNDTVKVKNAAISALTQDKDTLNAKLLQLGKDIEKCNSSLENANALINQKNQKILEISGNLEKCAGNSSSMPVNELTKCNTELAKISQGTINYFGLNLSVYFIQIVQIIFLFSLVITIPLSFEAHIENKRIAWSWIWAAILTAIVMIILENFIQKLYFLWHAGIALIVFILFYCLFYFGIIKND